MIITLSYIDYALLGALVLVIVYQCYFYLHYLTVANRSHQRAKCATSKPTFLPKVSVIVCARNERSNLQDYLHVLLTQDYPCYEVIVVNDGSEDDTQIILERYANQCKHLYTTFVPREARVISSKKLALTIGVKAANYDYLLLTDADCRPQSCRWIQEMIQGFSDSDQTEVVVGYGAYFEKKSLLSNIISYDTLFIALQYMGMAVAGHPYMGVGRNLAYKRDTFFRNGGFRGMLGERAGDDDLFVNKVTNNSNTAVVCSRDSITWSTPKTSWQGWLHQKRRHLSVSAHYKSSSKLRIVVEPLTRGLFYALVIATFIWGSGWAICAAYVLFLMRLVMQLCVMNTAAYRLGTRLFGIEIVVYDILLPLLSLFILLTQPLRKQKMYW